MERHRLSQAGNRKLNSALHQAAMSHKRTDPHGIAYYSSRKLAEGTGKKGALRCMKRRLSDAGYRSLVDDRARAAAAGREGHSGATLASSATARSPMDSTSEKSLTRPAAANGTPSRTRVKKAS
ncbi:MAG: transposase [Mycobacteriales bacterium]